MDATAKVNGNISFWYADIGGIPACRAALPGNLTADICIVGAGYTGLWTAYYLRKADPSLRVIVVEKEFAGFGASGPAKDVFKHFGITSEAVVAAAKKKLGR